MPYWPVKPPERTNPINLGFRFCDKNGYLNLRHYLWHHTFLVCHLPEPLRKILDSSLIPIRIILALFKPNQVDWAFGEIPISVFKNGCHSTKTALHHHRPVYPSNPLISPLSFPHTTPKIECRKTHNYNFLQVCYQRLFTICKYVDASRRPLICYVLL